MKQTSIPETTKPKRRPRVQVFFTQPSLTKQEFTQEVNINNIVAKYVQTGELPFSSREPVYADVTKLPDYHEARNIVAKAEQTFEAFPAQVREKFKNDPQEMFKWASDPNNLKEAINAGLIGQKPNETPVSITKNVDDKKETPLQTDKKMIEVSK